MTLSTFQPTATPFAQAAAGRTDLSIDKLDLRNIRWGGAVDVAEGITAASVSQTLDGPSTLVITVMDPGFELLNSPVLDLRADGRLNAIDVTLDTLGFRLVKVEPTWDASNAKTVRLTLEDREIALLRSHNSPLAVSRNNFTRAQFIRAKMINEIKAERIVFRAPEEFEKQAIDAPVSPGTQGANKPVDHFGSGAKINVKGVPADAEQRQNITTVMEVCDVQQAPDLARLAILCAGIGENQFRTGGTPSSANARGVFQLLPSTEQATGLSYKDVWGTAARFLLQGYYSYGGANELARRNPRMSPGEIASRVEGSATDAQNASYYDSFRGEAEAIVKAWNGGTPSGAQRTTVKQYQFTRGLPGKRETSWDAMQRLAKEVGWRCFAVNGWIWFVSDEWLFMQPAQATIGHDTEGLNGLRGDWDEGKTEQQVYLTVDAHRWAQPPGSVIVLRDLGPLTGRWLVHTIDRRDLFSPVTEITLIKPLPRKHEPAPSLINAARNASPAAQATVKAAYDAAAAIDRQNLPYVWGGGHAKAGTPDRGTGADPGIGYDCSGSCAAALHAAGMLPTGWDAGVPDSGHFASSWGDPGAGAAMTVWANAAHMFIEWKLASGTAKSFDTRAIGDTRSGPHQRTQVGSTAGFTARHWPGA